MLTQVMHAVVLSKPSDVTSSAHSAGHQVFATFCPSVLRLFLLTLYGLDVQVVKAPSSPAEDAMLGVQKGFMQVSVSMNEIQKRIAK